MYLKQPTREQRGPRIMFPYLVLLRVGFTMPQTVTRCAVRSYRTISPLPTAELVSGGRYIFCCTFRRFSPPRRYLAPCPMEPGLSSPDNTVWRDCLANSRVAFYTIARNNRLKKTIHRRGAKTQRKSFDNSCSLCRRRNEQEKILPLRLRVSAVNYKFLN